MSSREVWRKVPIFDGESCLVFGHEVSLLTVAISSLCEEIPW